MTGVPPTSSTTGPTVGNPSHARPDRCPRCWSRERPRRNEVEAVGTQADLIVGFLHKRTCLAALHFGVHEVGSDRYERLVVVHASKVPIAVHNGPSSQIASRLGNPEWANVHSVVAALGADPTRTLTVVEPGDPAEVIARHSTRAALVVLGPRRRRLLSRRDTASKLAESIVAPIVRLGIAGSPQRFCTSATGGPHSPYEVTVTELEAGLL